MSVNNVITNTILIDNGIIVSNRNAGLCIRPLNTLFFNILRGNYNYV